MTGDLQNLVRLCFVVSQIISEIWKYVGQFSDDGKGELKDLCRKVEPDVIADPPDQPSLLQLEGPSTAPVSVYGSAVVRPHCSIPE